MRKKPKGPQTAFLEAAAEAWRRKEIFNNILRQIEVVNEARESLKTVALG